MTLQAAPHGTSSIGRATAALIAITLAVKVLGFAEKQVIAYFFGAGVDVDAYFVALSIPMAVFLLVREMIEPAFLPLYVSHLESNRRSAGGRLFVIVGLAIIFITVPLVCLGWARADTLVVWLAPGFEADTLHLAARLVRIMIGAGAFLALSALTYITLNGHRRFALPATGDLVLKIAPIACAILLAPHLGIFALAVGLLIGSLGRILVHTLGLVEERRWLALPNAESKQDIRTLVLLTAPLILGVVFSQISELADNYFSSLVEGGAIAARTYARRIVDLPIVLVPYALSIVVFPYFSSLANVGDSETLFRFLARSLRALMLVFAFLAVSTIMLAEPIVSLLLERGAFDAHARVLTAWPLQFYAAGLVAFAVEAILVPFYFALRDTRTPIVVGIVGVCVNIALTAALISPLGVGGVALALTVSKSLKVVCLIVLLKRKRKNLRLSPALMSVVRIAFAAGLAALGIFGARALVHVPALGESPVAMISYLAIVSTAGAIVYLSTLLAWSSPERDCIRDGWEFIRARAIRLRR